MSLLRRLFGGPDRELAAELAELRARMAEWEVTMTGLTDKLSSQLKRLAARHGRRGEDSEAARIAELNEAIRARRRSRFIPLNGDE